MKTALQVVLSLVVAVGLLGIGFYVGSQPDLAAQLGLDSLLPATASGTNAPSAQAFQALRAQAGNGANAVQSTADAAPAGDNPAPAESSTESAGDNTSAPANGAARPGGFAGGVPPVEVSDDQLVEILPAGSAGADPATAATVAGMDQQPILLPLAGTIQTIEAAVGDAVAPGDLLLTLDGTALEATIEDALAELAAAQENLDTLNIDPVKNEASLPAAKERVADARAKVEAAAADLAATQVVAPVSGTVLSVDVKVGEEAAGGTPALVLSTGEAPATAASNPEPTGTGWLVPATAVQERNGNAMLFVVRDDQPTRVAVTKGEVQGELVLVESPELQAGDKVIADVTTLFQGGGFPGGGNLPGAGANGVPPNSRGGDQTQSQQP